MKKTTKRAVLILSLLVVGFSCQKDEIEPLQETEQELIVGVVTDPAGQDYQWQLMKDGRKWMVENLNYAIPAFNSWWYNDNPVLGEELGRLYDWEAAKTACAALGNNWSLPTADEWSTLVSAYGEWESEQKWDWDSFSIHYYVYSSDGYTALIKGGQSGFSALLGGNGNLYGHGGFIDIYNNGLYWSASDSQYFTETKGIIFNFHRPHNKVYKAVAMKNSLASCRCVQSTNDVN